MAVQVKGDGSLCALTPSSTSHCVQVIASVSLSGEQPSLCSWGRKEAVPGTLDGRKKCGDQIASSTDSSTNPPYLKLIPLHVHFRIWWCHLLRLWGISGYESSTDGLAFSFPGSAKLLLRFS